MPALGLALATPPTRVRARLTLTDGDVLEVPLSLPHVSAALCLKALAYGGRRSPRDAVDVWRLLEAAHAAGVRAAQWNPGGAGVRLDASQIVHRDFGTPAGPGARAATRDRPFRRGSGPSRSRWWHGRGCEDGAPALLWRSHSPEHLGRSHGDPELLDPATVIDLWCRAADARRPPQPPSAASAVASSGRDEMPSFR